MTVAQEQKAAGAAKSQMGSTAAIARINAWATGIRSYVAELHGEMKRVTWPNWKQVRSTTLVVIAAVFAFAGYFAVVDSVLGRAITKIFDTFTK